MPAAIPTEYNGVMFRSRLEARWAALFDALNTPWTYEPEGFQLDSGRYLPDFELHDLDLLVEIKPEGFSGDERHFELARTHRLAVLVGQPRQDNQDLVLIEPWMVADGERGCDIGYSFAKCDRCGIVSFEFPGGDDPARLSRCSHTWASRYGAALARAYAVCKAVSFWQPDNGSDGRGLSPALAGTESPLADRICHILVAGPLTTDRIADSLGVPAASVRVALSRGRGVRFACTRPVDKAPIWSLKS